MPMTRQNHRPFTFHGIDLRRMRRTALGAALILSLAGAASADELPLTRVVLSNAGLAQFTHSGTVNAGANVDLAVRLDQVDDILKSLTIFDKAGAIGAVSLPGKTPLAELFRDLPFGPGALDSSAALLNALTGSEIEIEGPVNAKGRVFRVEDEKVALPNNGGMTTRHRLTLMSATGLTQAILEDVTSLKFADAKTRAQIERALSGLSENQAKDQRKLSIGFRGEGARIAAISYVVAAPIWKTAYRLVLPKEGGKARLQGWAVIENLTGGDWSDIDLALVSANPVAFRQRLYTAFFADRIEIPVTAGVRLQPQTDDAKDKSRDGFAAGAAMESNMTLKKAEATRAVVAQQAQLSGGVAALNGPATPAPQSAPTDLSAAANAAQAEETSTQLLYQYPAKISLATGHSMMAPFLDREVAATRVWLYQPETSAKHPLAAVRLRNDGDSGLPAGIVTAYDAASDGNINFAGDAQLPLMPKGAFKYVTFALDSRTDIRREDKGVSETSLGKSVNGVLTVQTRSRHTIAYEVTAPAEEDREIVAEEAREDGWSPASDMKDVEAAQTKFRLAIKAAKGKTTKAELVLERSDSEEIELSTLGPDELLARFSGLQNESPALKAAIGKLSAITAAIAKATAQRAQFDAERQKIGADQQRIRQNLASVGAATDLGRRYVDSLRAQEDRLAEIARQDGALEKDMAGNMQAAEDLARALTL